MPIIILFEKERRGSLAIYSVHSGQNDHLSVFPSAYVLACGIVILQLFGHVVEEAGCK